jgi:GNAT superfamily N-acetyltransferase
MIQTLADVVLKNGQSVTASIVLAPEEKWRAPIEKLLHHKGEVWRWQIAQLLGGQSGIAARFYLLHRDDAPFSNILTIEHRGVGLLGHVWTQPEERGQGAASQLMRLVMDDFQSRGGRALFLSTGYDSPAFHIYRKQGFSSVEENSGVMAFFSAGREQFETDYFAATETGIVPLNWLHYVTASALLAHPDPTRLRCAPLGVLAPSLCEGPFLPVLRERESGELPRMVVLQKTDGAVMGVAAFGADGLWPGVTVLDVFCHPNFWHRGEELLAALPLPAGRRQVVYDDEQNPAKVECLRRAGFERQARLKERVPLVISGPESADVAVWERDVGH